MSLLLAQAAVNDANIHFDKLYSYRIPVELAGFLPSTKDTEFTTT